jgi:hypothetical protein
VHIILLRITFYEKWERFANSFIVYVLYKKHWIDVVCKVLREKVLTMDSNTLLACNRRYIISATGDRITTRRANDALTPLKPDYLAHKGVVTHIAIHQPDVYNGTQDDWGRVVASSDVTHRVKVWLCDGEEEELMFARNMAEYVGYEKVTALAWTGDSKVAIGIYSCGRV